MDPSPFANVGNKDRLVDKVVAEIQSSIISGRLSSGSMLPPERDLAEQLGVSRTVIREAAHILVTKGLLETRHGVGAFVRQVGSDQISDSLGFMLRASEFTLDHLHQVRSVLEVENAALAAVQATFDEIEAGHRLMAHMEAAMDDPDIFTQGDTEFHHLLAQMSHNLLLVLLLDALSDLMHEVRLSVARFPDLYVTVIPDHWLILKEVANRNPEGARRAMQRHLENARAIQKQLFINEADEI
jgi:GntR family transcriptional repressor for pyruvate dehydrogenase complex